MGWKKIIRLGPDGQKISETPLQDDGQWNRDTEVTIIDSDGNQSNKKFNFGDTQAEANNYIAGELANRANAAAVKAKSNELAGANANISALEKGANDYEAAMSGQNSLVAAQMQGGEYGSGDTKGYIDPRVSQVGQQNAALRSNLQTRGLGGPGSTMGMAGQKSIMDTASSTLNQARMKSAADVAAKKNEVEQAKAARIAKYGV